MQGLVSKLAMVAEYIGDFWVTSEKGDIAGAIRNLQLAAKPCPSKVSYELVMTRYRTMQARDQLLQQGCFEDYVANGLIAKAVILKVKSCSAEAAQASVHTVAKVLNAFLSQIVGAISDTDIVPANFVPELVVERVKALSSITRASCKDEGEVPRRAVEFLPQCMRSATT
jgi:hypothetical protein